MSDESVTESEPAVDPDEDHGDSEPAIPTTLEQTVTALEDERKRHSATRKESIQRRMRLKEAETRIAELEASSVDQWRTAALVAMVESEAVKQGARRPEVGAKLVDLDELSADDASELRLAIAEQVTAALGDAPELKRATEGLGALSPGPRQREPRHPREADMNARIRKSLRR